MTTAEPRGRLAISVKSPPDMFVCGNHDDARTKVAAILKDFGWAVVDVGGIECSRYRAVVMSGGGRTHGLGPATVARAGEAGLAFATSMGMTGADADALASASRQFPAAEVDPPSRKV